MENSPLFQELTDRFQSTLAASWLPQAAIYRFFLSVFILLGVSLIIRSLLIALTLSALHLSVCNSSSLNAVLP